MASARTWVARNPISRSPPVQAITRSSSLMWTFAARRRQRPLDIGNEKLQMEGPPLGKAIGGEAGHDDQPGDQCADDLEPETQAATNQAGYP